MKYMKRKTKNVTVISLYEWTLNNDTGRTYNAYLVVYGRNKQSVRSRVTFNLTGLQLY